MRFLLEGFLPEDEVERLCVERAANFFRVVGDKLYVVGKHDVLCEVPPIAEHWGIVDSVHRLSNSHPDAMYATLHITFCWKGMRADLHEFVPSVKPVCESMPRLGVTNTSIPSGSR